MKFSTAVVIITCFICVVRCGVILDRLKKVRCDLHHMGEKIISHGHLISDPCPHQQETNTDGIKYDNNRQDVATQTSKHGSAFDNSKHMIVTEDNRDSLDMLAPSTEETKHDRYDQKGNIVYEISTEAVKSKQHGNSADDHNTYSDRRVSIDNVSSKKNIDIDKNSAHDTYQGQQVSSDNATPKKKIDMEDVHAGTILFPGETGGGRDDIHDSNSKTGTEGARYDHSTTTSASVLTTTKAGSVDDADIERNLAKVKPNCPVVDKNKNCIQDY